MTTALQKVPGAFTDLTLPTTYIETMLNKGTLYMFDPAHPYLPWAAGNNANSNNIPNVAERIAAVLNPAATGAAFRGTLAVTGGVPTGAASSHGVVERTAKGGLHAVVSNVDMAASIAAGVQLRLNSGLTGYLAANTTHKYYASLWHRITRSVAGADAGTRASFAFSALANNDSVNLFDLASDGAVPAAGARRLGYDTDNQSAAGIAFRSLGIDGVSAAAANLGNTVPFQTGRVYSWSRGTRAAQPVPSHVLYRATLEDLTVSGRTYEQARAADLAAYTRDVVAVGGRYYGDTISTDPATIP